jgi:hypothetical protein
VEATILLSWNSSAKQTTSEDIWSQVLAFLKHRAGSATWFCFRLERSKRLGACCGAKISGPASDSHDQPWSGVTD